MLRNKHPLLSLKENQTENKNFPNGSMATTEQTNGSEDRHQFKKVGLWASESGSCERKLTLLAK